MANGLTDYHCHWLSTGDSAVVYILEGLRYNNPFGDDGGTSVAQVLCKENITLRVLDIHGTSCCIEKAPIIIIIRRRMSQHTEQKVRVTECSIKVF